MSSNVVVANEAAWTAAVRQVNGLSNSPATGETLTVALAAPTGTLELSGDTAAIVTPSSTIVAINGQGQTIDGNGIARGLFIHKGFFGGGTLTVTNLTIANTVAAGGDGGPGGGGGAGFGGGLFVGADSAVVLDGVNFVNTQAVGGAGGAGVLGGGGGMGGNGGAGDTVTGAGGGGGGLGRGAFGGDAGKPGGNGLLVPVFGTPFYDGTAAPGLNYGGGGGGLGAGNPGGHGGAGFITEAFYGGGGGGANPTPGPVFSRPSAAGFGGGGGSGLASAGGFGGGGGGAYGGQPAGLGGFAAGNGSASAPGGGGGLGAGGAIFVAAGGRLTIAGGNISGTAAGGAGGGGGTAGSGLGDAIFLQTTTMQNGSITLAAPSLTLSPGAGRRVSINGSIADDAGILLTGGGVSPGANITVTGAGSVALLAASSYAGGTTINGGTLELVTALAAGTGTIGFTPLSATLLIDGTAMPANTIGKFGLGNTIDLAGIVATASTALMNSSGLLAIPTAGGTIGLQFDQNTGLANGNFNLAPDGHGGTAITTDKAAVQTVVTVTGALGGSFAVPFTNTQNAYAAQSLADNIDALITANQAVRFVVDGSALPSVPAGQQLVLYDPAGLPVTLPDTVPAALFTNTAGAATITSGAASGDYIVAANGGLDFTAGFGLFDLVAGDGDTTITLAPGVGGGVITLGNGNATINAIGGNNIISDGTGDHVLTFGIGANTADVGGSNTVLGGPGNLTFYNTGGGNDLVLLGSGNSFYESEAGGAADTVASATGNDYVIDYNGAGIYFAGSGKDTYSGGGTVVGGSGPLDVLSNSNSWGPVPDLLAFAGTGATHLSLSPGSPTVVGNSAGSMSVDNFGANTLLFAEGSTTVQGYGSPSYPPAVDTIIGITGSLDLIHEAGLFLAGPAGNNTIDVVGNSTVFGTAAGDVLSSSELDMYAPYYGTANDILVGGAGAETISGAGSTAINVFFAGSGPEFIQAGDWSTSIVTSTGAATIAGGRGISLTAFVSGRHPEVVMQSFNPARDYLTFINFGAGEAVAALAGAHTVAGSEVLTLSDGTHITFQGFTGLGAANIL